jgi:hypothetical protein
LGNVVHAVLYCALTLLLLLLPPPPLLLLLLLPGVQSA